MELKHELIFSDKKTMQLMRKASSVATGRSDVILTEFVASRSPSPTQLM